ncbi:hypothetical protein [Marinobacter sp. AC-23]|uniref:hypothetical protein n=1 Tax=Marinobacter sp. AC-23 TaxID=1879031 RepID=UPI0008DD4111|nr:hypothetical protein [Marinobacter sp. AC-23]OHY72932.1 hypothetical protein BCA33_18890 [Marinobacter sp. AC-23]
MRAAIIPMLLLLASSNASSGPNKTVSYLMNEPLTMFEWGLYKVKDEIFSIEFEDLDLTFRNLAGVEYDWEGNRINLSLTIYPEYAFFKKVGGKKICKLALQKVKSRFGYGVEAKYRELFGINTYFEHKGFTNKSKPESLAEDLENITKIMINVYSSESNRPMFKKMATCSSMLLEDDVYFLEEADL